MKTAFISGITGQDGSYLAELLLSKGYEVHGLIRRSSNFNCQRIEHLFGKIALHHGDLADAGCLMRILGELKPDEVYHLGAQSHVRVSFEIPEYSGDVTGIGTTRLLEAVRLYSPKSRVYNAASSEMYGKVQQVPQNELTPFYPRSPYGCAKMYAYWLATNYRESYGLHISSGILFNHESPRRGETFVTRKITRALARIHKGLDKELYLGNLDAKRDWGYAPEYVEAMWRMLQQDSPDDYVIATGETHSVREFLHESLAYYKETYSKGYMRLVQHDPRMERPAEVDLLIGDASKAQAKLGWKPKVTFKDLVRIMVEHDLALVDA